ncbi:MAG TPA: hypothetical protein VFQ16_14680, partial [Burkholderiaceae bacterium]|nr:hypothetical protein [Burkholderiaceae bacterium]
RAQYHVRQICVVLNLQPLTRPEVFANAYNGSFDATGELIDPAVQALVREQMAALQEWTLRLRLPLPAAPAEAAAPLRVAA